ncbi:MAG: carbohydrate binding family 9 domain-containing protein [Acidimicrobiia bacterium]|nr:carbohydrate binding family 9 domain-containing protein [Acidimicrobiia bacterium]
MLCAISRRVRQLTVAFVLIGGPAFAQNGEQTVTQPSGTLGLPAIVGPPAPTAPAVATRDDQGRVTLRAVRLPTPLRVDGRLDEEIYGLTQAISDFIQNDPKAGAPATEKTELWLFFDRNNFYVSARCWESQPDQLIANEMRRDSVNIVQNDGLAFGLDTFYDHRNSVMFEISAVGGRIDGQVTNERQMNLDWNPVWNFKVGRFEGGWTLEVAIPFKSLRYQPGRGQVWGFNARRINQSINEVSYITRIPTAMQRRGHFLASLMATLVGIEAPPAARNIEIKPYAIADTTTDLTGTTPVRNRFGRDVGADARIGLSQSASADLTLNTDFAQVEADEQQVNLTRFSLFFPEKREFFLENQGTFGFGGAGTAFGGGTSDTPILFYSRRVGLSTGTIAREVPIDAGARVTGRVGRYTLGLLNIQAGDDELTRTQATNFSVLRVRRDLLRKSNLGAMYTGRSIAQGGEGRNDTFGLDATFGFYDNLMINTYWAQTRTEGRPGDDGSYRAQLDYTGDRYGVQVERLVVGRNFNPEVGFVRRRNMERSFGQLRFSPRVRRFPSVRRLFASGQFTYVENQQGRLESRNSDGELAIEYQNGDRPFVGYGQSYEFLPAPFPIATNVTLPSQGYSFDSVRAGYTFGQRRRVSGTFIIDHGTFYGGRKTSYSLTRGRIFLTAQLAFEPRVSVDRVDLPEGRFTNTLLGSRVTYTITPLMFVSALLQYNSSLRNVSFNARLRWEYRPGSELFVVWNEQRDTIGDRMGMLANRALIVKINRLVRF